MLSTENPPVDLSCSLSSPVIPQICSDEKGSNQSNQQSQPNSDLLKSSPDENKKQVPNFSIRGYVFSSRGKDIKNHWPFSPKNLQLCLNHGVSNVLPPFETPYSVRNPSPPVDSQSQELPELATETSKKVVRTTQNPGKSCKVTAKPTKDSMKTTSVTDAMASKLCPVCKSFSSSSNTTLNAHIDQCLSGAPVSNSTSKSRAIKHRIVKPRKIRLMVDIYETALRCTLEDLDRRNGTNWASNTNPANKDFEATLSTTPLADDEDDDNGMFSPVNNVAADKDDDGAVYVDSTGTKLRILSKSSDLRCDTKSADDRIPKKKLVERGKGHNFLSSKKKYLLQNRKVLKAPSRAKILDRCSKQAKNYEQENLSSREGFEKSSNLGIFKKWVGSKRTVPRKRNNPEHEGHRLHNASVENIRGTKKLSPLNSNHELREGTNGSSLPRTEKKDRGKKSPKDRISSTADEEKRENTSPVVRKSRYQPFSSGDKGFASRKSPSLHRKKLLSSSKKNPGPDYNLASVSRSKRSIETNNSEPKRRKLQYSSESDEEYIAPRSSAARRQQDDESFDEIPRGEDSFLGERVLFNEPSNDIFTDLKVRNPNSGSKFSLASIGCCTLNTEAAVEEVEDGKEIEGPDLIALDKYLDSPLPPYDECVPQHYVKAGSGVNTEAFPTRNKKHSVITEANYAAMGTDENERERDFHENIDPIPIIPVPPGFFLPSPVCRGSDDQLQGRSSLTSCNKRSEDDEREFIDMNSSDSPISGASNVSNSIRSDFPKNDKIHRAEEKCREARAATMLNSGPPPCSCSRKDLAYRSNFLEYRDPRLVGENTTNPVSLHPPVREKQRDCSGGYNGDGFSSGLEVLTNFSEGSRICHELPGVSTPNPVLRLMGKNLTVVNKDDNFLPETRPTTNGHLYARSFSDKALFDENWESSYSNTVLRHGPLVLEERTQPTFHGAEFGGGFSRPQLFPQKSFSGSFTHREYASRDPEKVTKPVELIVIDGSPRENDRVESFHNAHSRGAHGNIAQNSYYYCGQVPYCMGTTMQENVEKWRATAENSRILSSRDSFTASSSLYGSSPHAPRGFPSDEYFS